MLLQPLPGLRDFELVPLSTTDRQILRATSHKLQNHATIPTACSNFREVLLADFPAEVFLQYPDILQSTALSGSISTVLTVLSWICLDIHSRRALPCPVCA